MTLRDLQHRLEAAADSPRQRVRLYVRCEEIPGLMKSLRAADLRLAQHENAKAQAEILKAQAEILKQELTKIKKEQARIVNEQVQAQLRSYQEERRVWEDMVGAADQRDWINQIQQQQQQRLRQRERA